MINNLIDAIYMTMELWIFLGILGVALVIEEGVVAHNRKKLVDNPALK
jgi:hypothetical protein